MEVDKWGGGQSVHRIVVRMGRLGPEGGEEDDILPLIEF